jgi:hypothetical protein
LCPWRNCKDEDLWSRSIEGCPNGGAATYQEISPHSENGVNIPECQNCLDFNLLLTTPSLDELTEDSLARKEYNIDPSMQLGEIRVKELKPILQIAQSGLVYSLALSIVLYQLYTGR